MKERHLRLERRMEADTRSIWELFADFPNLATFWNGLRSTVGVGDQSRGLGARRRVALKPVGGMDEEVTAWEEGRRIDTENKPSLAVPIKRARSSLTLEADGPATRATFDYYYVPRGGPVGRLSGPLIDRMLTSTFADMLAAAERAASAQPPAP